MEHAPPAPRRRRFWKLAGVLLAGLVVALAALPWIAGTAPVRNAIVAAANGALAPAKLEVGSLRTSWNGTTVLGGVVLRDGAGKELATVRRATLDRGLVPLVFDRPHYGTLTIERADLAIERRADGSIDLLDALRPAPAAPAAKPAPSEEPQKAAGPAPEITIVVRESRLKVSSPELAAPIVADPIELTAHLPGHSGPITWKVKMTNPGASGGTMAVEGSYDARTATETAGDLVAAVVATRWPIALNQSGIAASAVLDGKFEAHHERTRWTFASDAGLLDLDASGPALSGDRLRLDRVGAVCDLTLDGTAWTIRALDLSSPLATVSARGTVAEKPGSTAHLAGRVDLAALARQVPNALRLRDGLSLDRGAATLSADVRSEADGQRLDLSAAISDLAGRDASKAIVLRDPATLTAQVRRQRDEVEVETVGLKTAFLDVSGKGSLAEGVVVTGTIDLTGLQAELHEIIDFGAVTLAGKGGLSADYRKAGDTYTGRFAGEIRQLRIAGVNDEPIERDLARVEAAVTGPAAPSGMPQDVDKAKFGLLAGPTRGSAEANPRDGGLDWHLTLESPIPITGHDAHLATTLAGRRKGRIYELDAGHVAIGFSDARPPVALDLTATGRLDLDAGALALKPRPDVPPGAIGLGAAGLKVTGLMKPDGAGPRIEGALAGNAAALDQFLAGYLAQPAQGLAGTYTAQILVEPGTAGMRAISAQLQALDLTRPDGAHPKIRHAEPIAIAAILKQSADRIDLESLAIGSRYADLSASGRVDDPAGRRVADLQGTLKPKWATLGALFAESVEPTATIKGGPERAFRVKGPLSGDTVAAILKGLDAEVGFDRVEIEAFGVKVAPMPLVLTCGGGRAVFQPIATTVNGGNLDLKSELVLDDPRGLALRIGAGSNLSGAEINDEVTTKLLSYVAPVLHDATRVTGRVGARIERGEIPIGGDEKRTMTLLGQVVFVNVVFAPGPKAEQIIGLSGTGRKPSLQLHQPVNLTIADGRVNQQGLSIPLAKNATLDIAGSVGFDKTLALRAEVPIPTALIGQRGGGLGSFVAGKRITVPIGGTMANPVIDRQAFQASVRNVAESLLKHEGADLLRNLGGIGGPADPSKPGGSDDVKKLGEDLLKGLLQKRR